MTFTDRNAGSDSGRRMRWIKAAVAGALVVGGPLAFTSTIASATIPSAAPQIVQVVPTITTVASTSPVVAGAPISDTATLANGSAPTGTITFSVFGPNDATCTTTAAFTSTATVNGNGNYTSAGFANTSAGTYRFVASYGGDTNNAPISGTCNDTNESVVVTQASPTLTTQASSAVTLGGQVSDAATLSGGSSPTGTVTFKLFGPNNSGCVGTPIFVSTKTVNGDGSYTSASFTPTAVGSYQWLAVYSGDTSNTGSATACGDSNESVSVNPVPPGSLTVTNVAPASAQGVTFSFGIFCSGVTGSPFTVNVTGSGVSNAVSVPAGSHCLASATVVSGFVPQPNQNYATVTPGGSQTVTFTQTTTTGGLTVTNVAPANSQTVTFTFGIFCSGVTGSPFTINITGSGVSSPVVVPGGSSCFASASQTPGFVALPNQNYQPVVSGGSQNVTFTQAVNTGTLTIKNVAPASAQGTDFTFGIFCQGVTGSPFTIDVVGSGTSSPLVVAGGSQCLASASQTPGFVPLQNQNYQPVAPGSSQTVTFTQAANSGGLTITDVVPTDAQTVTFTFGIFCTGVTGSPFTVHITGSATSGPIVVPAGSQCLASESTHNGFVDRPNQNYAPVVAGVGQNLTFTQTRSTGTLRIHNVAPNNAQTTTFNFGIFCTGVTGSPFTVSVVGTGTSTGVVVPGGSHCTASATQLQGFATLPNQNYQPVAPGSVQTLTFTQTPV